MSNGTQAQVTEAVKAVKEAQALYRKAQEALKLAKVQRSEQAQVACNTEAQGVQRLKALLAEQGFLLGNCPDRNGRCWNEVFVKASGYSVTLRMRRHPSGIRLHNYTRELGGFARSTRDAAQALKDVRSTFESFTGAVRVLTAKEAQAQA